MIHVVVVAYRSADHIGPCLEPLMKDPFVSTVVVVDNSADAATEAVCRRWRSDSRLEYLPGKNIGYAAACNLGAARVRGTWKFLAIINPDVTLHRPLSELAELTTGVLGSIFSARLQQPSGSLNARPMAGPMLEILNAFVGSRVYRLPSVARHPPSPGFVQVPQIDGSLLLMPAREAAALDGFDERYELYYEDVDFCRRANLRAGCHLWLESWGTHQAGASFSVAGEPPFIALRVSRTRYLRKWYGRIGVLWALLVAMIEAVSRAATGQAPSRRAILHALVAQSREVVQPGRKTYLA